MLDKEKKCCGAIIITKTKRKIQDMVFQIGIRFDFFSNAFG